MWFTASYIGDSILSFHYSNEISLEHRAYSNERLVH